MARSNKTSNVLKMLNLEKKAEKEKTPDIPAEVHPQPVKVMPEPTPTPPVAPLDSVQTEAQIQESPPLERKKRPRKAIVKHMKLEKLSEPGKENPALKALAPSDEPVEEIPRIYIRGTSADRQIVSVPLLLINEQLGTAVERFNVCACDDCLGEIIIRSLALMPPMYVRVLNAADEEEVNRLINERRAEAIRALTKVCMTSLIKPFHEKQ